MSLKIKLLNKDAMAPSRQSVEAAGYDLYSSFSEIISPEERRLIPLGFSMSIPKGYYGRIAPRSGLSVKKSIDIGAGVIDSDYRGEVKVLIINNGRNIFHVKPGDRIAQLIIEKIITPPPEERRLISLGFSMSIPKGYYGRIAPRSGLSVKKDNYHYSPHKWSHHCLSSGTK